MYNKDVEQVFHRNLILDFSTNDVLSARVDVPFIPDLISVEKVVYTADTDPQALVTLQSNIFGGTNVLAVVESFRDPVDGFVFSNTSKQRFQGNYTFSAVDITTDAYIENLDNPKIALTFSFIKYRA